MLFCSYQFLLFFVIVFSGYWLLPWSRGRVWWLLAASCYFYASWNAWLALLIVASASLDFGLAHGIVAIRSAAGRKIFVAISITANLGLLCYFKYANFFLKSLEELLIRCGAEVSFPLLKVILPIGISFYTFEAISYIVDVYRGRVVPERRLENFLLFILFFPHLVAGPIVRSRDFLPQIRRAKRFNWTRMEIGLQLFMLGMIKKFLIADRMALYVDPVFANPGVYSNGAIWVAVVAYALQIYGDFSGYTDMALGSAQMLGYHLAINFNMPYLARNISEFWRRWHISLSSWLRDYLFIPLGGSRGGTWQTCRNLLITMTLGGLWHGDKWTFVLWGILHGLLLIAHRLFTGLFTTHRWWQRYWQSIAGHLSGVVLTFLCVNFCWVLFRAETLEKAGIILHRLVQPLKGGVSPPLPVLGFWCLLGLMVCGHAFGQSSAGPRYWQRIPVWVRAFSFGVLVLVMSVLAPPSGQAFIYFQF